MDWIVSGYSLSMLQLPAITQAEDVEPGDIPLTARCAVKDTWLCAELSKRVSKPVLPVTERPTVRLDKGDTVWVISVVDRVTGREARGKKDASNARLQVKRVRVLQLGQHISNKRINSENQPTLCALGIDSPAAQRVRYLFRYQKKRSKKGLGYASKRA